MTNPRVRALGVFRELLDASLDGRQQALHGLEQDDPAVASEVRALLEADQATPSFLDASAADLAGAALVEGDPGQEAAVSFGEGQRIGAWQVEELIGRGGSSLVFRVHRADAAVEQTAALKLFVGTDISGGEEHFLQEQRILSTLNHPNIASLIEGGTTDQGLPYCVMELVEGEPIDDYCRRLDLDDRGVVELMRTVCEAVSYAQRHLIVHRDLKPANVLVDSEGRVRLLDFGIAKLLDEGAEGQTVRMLTPGFAAPEQLRGEAVTTATDVYGLGVVLSVLLARELPEDFLERSPLRPHRTPVKPLAERSTADPSRDLNLIVGKATHEDATRRYESAQGLADDLDNWLERRPVTAAPDRLLYRLRLFVRRYRVPVAAAALALVAVLAGASVALWQASVARQQSERALRSAAAAEDEARRADGVTEFLIEAFSAADPSAASGGDVTASEILEEGVRRIERDGQIAAEDRVHLLTVLGHLSFKLGDMDRGSGLIVEALGSIGALRPAEQITTLVRAAAMASDAGDYAAAEDRFSRALQLAREEDQARVPEVLVSYAVHASDSREYARAIGILEPLVGADGDFAPDLAERRKVTTAVTMATGLYGLNRLEEALAWSQKARAVAEQVGDRVALAAVLSVMAGVEEALGNLARAVEMERASLEVRVEAHGPDHPHTLVGKNNLATLLKNLGQFDESATMLQEVIESYLSNFGETHPNLDSAWFNLGGSLLLAERHPEAAHALRQAVDFARVAGADKLPIFDAYRALHGRALARAGDPARGLRETGDGYGSAVDRLGRDHPLTARIGIEHAGLLNDLERSEEALAVLEGGAEVLLATYGERSRYEAVALIEEARALAATGASEAAVSRARAGVSVLAASPYAPRYWHEIELGRAVVARLSGD